MESQKERERKDERKNEIGWRRVEGGGGATASNDMPLSS